MPRARPLVAGARGQACAARILVAGHAFAGARRRHAEQAREPPSRLAPATRAARQARLAPSGQTASASQMHLARGDANGTQPAHYCYIISWPGYSKQAPASAPTHLTPARPLARVKRAGLGPAPPGPGPAHGHHGGGQLGAKLAGASSGAATFGLSRPLAAVSARANSGAETMARPMGVRFITCQRTDQWINRPA